MLSPLPSLKIRHKIVIPFTVLLMLAAVGIAIVAVSVTSTMLERRVRSQIDHVSQIVSESGFALNRQILERLKRMLAADVVTYARDGTVLVTTLAAPADAALLREIQAPDVATEIFDRGRAGVIRKATHDGKPYMIAYRPLDAPNDTLVALVVDTSDNARVQRAIAQSVGVITIVIVLLVAVAGHLIARSITSPVQRLVEFTTKLASGDRTLRADVTIRDEIGRLAAAFNEMTERVRESEERLLQSEKLATAGQLAVGVAHDIRNPLSTIKILAQMLRTKLQPGVANQELLRALLAEVERVERVLKGLLDRARPGDLELREGAVNEVVREALAITDTQLRHRKIATKTLLHPAIPPIMLDADRLRQALLNLIANAADAMPDGGTLEVSTGMRADGAVTIEILDEGSGIDPEIRAKVFDPFFTTKPEGVGLGLANTKSVVERHGGRLDLTPGEGKGTRAIVTLPVTPRASAA